MRSAILFALAFASVGAVACATTTSTEGNGTDTAPTSPNEAIPSDDQSDGTSSSSSGGSKKTGSSSSSSSTSSTSSSSSGGSSSGGSSSGGSSSGGSSSGSLPDSCTPVGTSCVKGGSMTYCISYTGNTCSKIAYEHDGVSASCSCGGGTDCTDAYYVAYTDCQDAKGACADLDSCCDTIDSNYEPTCRSYVTNYQGQSYGDVSCKSVLTSWQSSGLCP